MAADETIEQLAKQRLPLVSHEAEKGICLDLYSLPHQTLSTIHKSIIQYVAALLAQNTAGFASLLKMYNLQTMTGW